MTIKYTNLLTTLLLLQTTPLHPAEILNNDDNDQAKMSQQTDSVSFIIKQEPDEDGKIIEMTKSALHYCNAFKDILDDYDIANNAPLSPPNGITVQGLQLGNDYINQHLKTAHSEQ